MLNAMSPMTLMWLVALILFGIAEAATVGLVSIWFAVGTIPALIVSALGGPVWLQVLLFLAVSILMLAMLRPFVRRISAPRARTNADRHIGQTAIVTETVRWGLHRTCGTDELAALVLRQGRKEYLRNLKKEIRLPIKVEPDF